MAGRRHLLSGIDQAAHLEAQRHRLGLVQGLTAFLIWGFLPLFFHLVRAASPGEIVAQRILWSVLLLGIAAAIAGKLRHIASVLRQPRSMLILVGSATMIAINWVLYVWAVNNGHVLAASLGYFLNPMVNVALGVAILGERMSKAQKIAVALAAIGVAVLASRSLEGLWISLSLALSFGTYGLLRKIAPVEAMEGLAIETLLLAPIAGLYILWLSGHGGIAFGSSAELSMLLIFSGALTATPLLLFAAAARKLRYATVGLLQYLAPTIQFLLAVTFYGEPFTTAHLICFAFIWTGLAIYATDSLRGQRAKG